MTVQDIQPLISILIAISVPILLAVSSALIAAHYSMAQRMTAVEVKVAALDREILRRLDKIEEALERLPCGRSGGGSAGCPIPGITK